MPQVDRKQAIGVKVESTQGTAVALAATDFGLAYDIKFTPMVELTPQKYVSTSFSRFRDIPGKKYYKVKFTLPLKGSGTAGTANAPLDAAFQSCGFTSTVTGGVSCVYAPTSAAASGSFYGAGKSSTVKGYQDGMLHVAAGCLFNYDFELVNGLPVGVKFEGMGVYAAVTDASFPTLTMLTNDPPIVKSAALSIQSYAAIVSKLSVKGGNKIAMRDDVNSANAILGFQITDRDIQGSFDPERPLIATHDFWALMMAGTEASGTVAVGGTAGNIITITAPKLQYGLIEPSERNELATLNVPLLFNRSSGDDELVLTFT